MKVAGQRHYPAALSPGKTRYPFYRRLRGHQGRSGGVRKISPPTGIRFPDHLARSKSLYWLSYPGPHSIYIYLFIYLFIYLLFIFYYLFIYIEQINLSYTRGRCEWPSKSCKVFIHTMTRPHIEWWQSQRLFMETVTVGNAECWEIHSYWWLTDRKQKSDVLKWLRIAVICCDVKLFVFSARAPPPQWAMASSFTRFLDHTQRRTTVGRTPLDEWSARHRDLYLTTHNTHNRETSMHPVGLEPIIPASEP